MAEGASKSSGRSTVRGRARKRGFVPGGTNRRRAVRTAQKSYDAGNIRR